ncbi:MAG TPA: metalloregulator ArsR/SmtB family transcription factor [Vicinamibacterales bacterium]|jgi:ArsR family transcriptional regulator|nr:metalloregulator ArsR/SmtB family transcription factor [Vicinamibacterales bacterium]
MDAAPLFRLLGDDVRLRILRLLAAERLNVSELTGILGIAQSGVSRHLGLLKDAGLVEERREGTFTFFRVSQSLASGDNGFGGLWPVLSHAFESTAATAAARADDARLEEVRRLRKENFDEHGDPEAGGRQLVPGRSWAAWARALAHLMPRVVVADIGCGEGYLTVEAARFAERVIAIDRSATMLERGRELARRRRVRNIRWKRGDIEALPLEDSTIDLALLSQALHHANDPARALAEAARVTKPGGRLLLLDLRRHDQQWVSETLGDRWLGFDDDDLAALLRDAGLVDVRVSVGARRARDPFTVLVASGTKPPAGTQPARTARKRSHVKHD